MNRPMDDKPNRLLSHEPTDLDKVVGIAARTVVELAPGGSLLTGAWAARQEQIAAAIRDQDQHRLDQFFADMLAGKAMDEQVAQKMLDSKDFHALLRACLADIEAEKVHAYANLARVIATGNVPVDLRRHFVLSLRDLSEAELGLLRLALVVTEHSVIPPRGTHYGLSDVFGDAPPGSSKSIMVANLTTRGFVHEVKLTQLGAAFTKACWTSHELVPASLGLETWTGLLVTILDYEIGSGSALDQLAMTIEAALRRAGIKCQIVAPNHQLLVGGFRRPMCAVLLTSSASKGIAKEAKTLAKFLERAPTILVRTSDQAVLPAGVNFDHEIDAAERPSKAIASEVLAAIGGVRASRAKS